MIAQTVLEARTRVNRRIAGLVVGSLGLRQRGRSHDEPINGGDSGLNLIDRPVAGFLVKDELEI